MTTTTSTTWDRIVLHVDMDAFYAAIEQRDDPSLRGKPVIIGGAERRGVVSTASYEARPYGVHSAMPGYRAKQLCPDGIFISPRIGYYSEISDELMAILGRYAVDVEPLSLDEAFLDMTGTEALFGPPEQTARRIQEDILRELSLTASIGVARLKYIAKVSSDLEKPAGITVCPPGRERQFLAPLPIERLWGVGQKTAPKVRALGLNTIGDVADMPRAQLQAELGQLGVHIWHLSRGEDPRRVESGRKRKSLGSERTLGTNISGRAAIREKLLPIVDEVTSGLRRANLRAAGVRLKIKYATFQSISRQHKLLEPAQDRVAFIDAMEALLSAADLSRPIRLVGLTAFDLVEEEAPRQQSLFEVERPRNERLDQTLDAVREKFGKTALTTASSIGSGPRDRMGGFAYRERDEAKDPDTWRIDEDDDVA